MASPDARLPVSVIIPTRNESLNLAAAIASVAWAKHVFVVDSQSTDDTVSIAESMGADVVQFHYDGGWPKKKNWALRNLPLDTEWILLLDADERVTPELRDEIAHAIQRPEVVGYYIRWKFMFLGRWMKRAWRHGWMLRLFRRERGEYEDLGMRGEGGWDNEVHENVRVQGPTALLRAWLVHDSRQDLSHWVHKQNEFSDWNAVRRQRELNEPLPPATDLFSGDPLRRRRLLKALYLRLPAKPLLMFFYLYIGRLGFLDGRPGLYFCALRAVHELNTEVKIYANSHTTARAENGGRATP
jgi:hypothetical protein